ncbi:MAG: peptidoglycan-binding protein, partial [Gammaproteobacteria bacterium]|nr:peptidoglycan-binding protein [Gammaproteobacteria bacterium]
LSGITIFAIAIFLYLTLKPASDFEQYGSDGPSPAIAETQVQDTPMVSDEVQDDLPITASPEQTPDEILRSPETDPVEKIASADKEENTTLEPGNAVTTLPAEDDAVTDHDDIETIFNGSNNSQASAFQELFKAWNYSYNNKIVTTACKQAETFSLRCLYKYGNLNSLRAHDRPAVLTLVNDQGKKRHITITSIRDNLATIYSNNTEYTISLNDIDRYWYGQFILLWHKPDEYSAAITPGDRGNIVSWLNTQFFGDRATDNSNNYDDTLIKKVKAFQAQHGLTADGIVGPVTIIHLNTKAGMDVPTLVAQS